MLMTFLSIQEQDHESLVNSALKNENNLEMEV